MATPDQIKAAIAKAEAAGRKDLAEKLRAYLPAEPAAPDTGKIEAAIAKAEAKGRTDLADKLRGYLPAAPSEPAATPAPATGRADPVAGTPEARQLAIDDFALFEMANPQLRGRYTPETMPEAGEMVIGGSGGGGKSGAPRIQVQPWRTADVRAASDTFGETAKTMLEGPVAAMQAFGGGLAGGDSPSRDYLISQGFNPTVAAILGVPGDAGGAVLSGLGAGISGLIGLGTELVPGQTSADEAKLGNDLLGMSTVAVPELAGVSSVPARVAAAAPKVPPVVAAPKAAPVVPKVAETVASVPETVVATTPEQIGALARKAADGGMGSVKAQEELAKAARVNPEAKAAADRLGIDLPVDVFSDDPNVLAVAGLSRSEVGKEAEALWRNAVKGARDKAEEIMAAMDGSPDIASVSESVKSSLQATRDGLKKTAAALYDAVDAAVPKSTKANVTNVVKALNEAIEGLGGPGGMSQAERALYNIVTGDQPLTYGRLIREKNLIGKAIARGDSPYSSLDSYTLGKMYGALTEDQMATVAQAGDATLRAKLREANQLTAKQKGLEKRIVSAFGSDLDGSIGAKLRSAVTQASKGDIAGLVRTLKVIPDDLKKTAMASALAAATRSARATEPGFGLSEFAKTFSGIKANKPVYNLIGKTLGPEAMAMLNDLNTVARRIAQADSNVLRTGKANQALVNAVQADGLVSRVLQSAAGKNVAQAAAIGATSAVGGPVAGMIAGPVMGQILAATPETLAKVGRLFASDEFQKLAVEAAKGTPTAKTVEAVKRTQVFKDWAKGVKDADKVLLDTGAVTGNVAAQGAANSTARPEYEALWGRYGQ
jgi:hypothetical protein